MSKEEIEKEYAEAEKLGIALFCEYFAKMIDNHVLNAELKEAIKDFFMTGFHSGYMVAKKGDK